MAGPGTGPGATGWGGGSRDGEQKVWWLEPADWPCPTSLAVCPAASSAAGLSHPTVSHPRRQPASQIPPAGGALWGRSLLRTHLSKLKLDERRARGTRWPKLRVLSARRTGGGVYGADKTAFWLYNNMAPHLNCSWMMDGIQLEQTGAAVVMFSCCRSLVVELATARRDSPAPSILSTVLDCVWIWSYSSNAPGIRCRRGKGACLAGGPLAHVRICFIYCMFDACLENMVLQSTLQLTIRSGTAILIVIPRILSDGCAARLTASA